jgi:hypothetical protein
MAAKGSPQDSDFFYVEPLPISGVSLKREGLHDMLKDSKLKDNKIKVNVDEEDVDYFPFTNFNSSYIMDSTEILGNSCCDTIQENEKMHCASRSMLNNIPLPFRSLRDVIMDTSFQLTLSILTPPRPSTSGRQVK